jgi:dTDP-4-amino-4,6-dideoxygalactose transaminase
MIESAENRRLPALEGGEKVRASFLPFHRPILGEEEIREVTDTLRSGWLTTGPRTQRFEREFAAYLGVGQAIGLNSCTAGIHLALVDAGVGPGDEVVMPAVSFPCTANMVVHQGATPVFADVEKETLNLDAGRLRERVNERTRAVIAVHFAGHPCDMDGVLAVAGEHGLTVIEDCAHALEASHRGRRVGSLGDYASFSFYATKNITTGEGGMLLTRHEDRLEHLQMLSLHGLSRDAWKRYSAEGYQHWETLCPGFKYNMYDIQAAIGLHQLRKVGAWLDIRRRWTERYDRAFADLGLLTPLRRRGWVDAAHHLYVILLDLDKLCADRDRILNALQAENIGIGVHFRAVHLHPYYRARGPHGPLPVAEWATERMLSLPLCPSMEEGDVEDVIRAVKKVLGYYRK